MLNWKSIALAALLLLPLATPSRAAMMTAQDLLSACSGGGPARATCDGYLMAVTDLALRRAAHANRQARICLPAEVTIDQVRDAVLQAGGGGRVMRAPFGLGLVAVALRRTWPCAGGGDFRGPGRFPRQNGFRGQGNPNDMPSDQE